MTRLLEILYNEGSDTIVLGDTETGDDIAEVFHNERHTVNQTVKQALETARLFAAAPDLLAALRDILEASGTEDGEGEYRTDDREGCLDFVEHTARAAIAKATTL